METVFNLDGDHWSKYFLSAITCLSEEQGASNKILSKHSVCLVHHLAPSLQETVILSAISKGKQSFTVSESRLFLSEERSFEESFA